MIAKDSAQDITTENRLRGAVWGQFVGDAAALGTHWIYDLSELSARFPSGIFGFEAPAAGDYHESKKPGDQTHYGDGALVLLESIAEHLHEVSRAAPGGAFFWTRRTRRLRRRDGESQPAGAGSQR